LSAAGNREDRLLPRAIQPLLLVAAAGIPVSLLWDFSWESTVGIDVVWGPAHLATYLSVALAGIAALLSLRAASGEAPAARPGVRLGGFEAPLGAWVALWGAGAFVVATLFDRWWQTSYGLAAGIWHPPQLLKAAAFFAVLAGVWLYSLGGQNRAANKPGAGGAAGAGAFVAAGGTVLAMTAIVTLISAYPNRQHSATFFEVACGVYPLLLVALAGAGRSRFSATLAALGYMALFGAMVWVLPLFPAKPQVSPVYNALDHLMPPPFPLLLIVPALGLDLLLRVFPPRAERFRQWPRAGEAGLAFFLLFTAVQWFFSAFLLSAKSDNRFFAGGGQHWPFFLKIDGAMRTAFWDPAHSGIDLRAGLAAATLAVLSARLGLWLGDWMKRLRRG
jgi:hypothetical protein